MVTDRFLGATLTSRRGGHTPFVQAGAETSDTGAEWLRRTHVVLGIVSYQEVSMSGTNVRNHVVFSNHFVFPGWSVQSAALVLLPSEELMNCCAAGTNGCLDLRCHGFPPG